MYGLGTFLKSVFAESPRSLGTLWGRGGVKETQVVFMWLIIAYLFSPLKDAISNLQAWGFHAREREKKKKVK